MWIRNIYGPTVHTVKDYFWLQLEMHRYGKVHLLCIIARDFNVTISREEKKGGSKVRDTFREILEDVIASWRFVDIKKMKGKYTWNNKHSGPGPIEARLDRILVNSSFIDKPLIPI